MAFQGSCIAAWSYRCQVGAADGSADLRLNARKGLVSSHTLGCIAASELGT